MNVSKIMELIDDEKLTNFKAIYEDIAQNYNDKFTDQDSEKLYRFDSTIMTLSRKLLKDGINCGGAETDRHIKISVGLKRSIPSKGCADVSHRV